MELTLSTPWQVSPLTDLSLPQLDMTLPAAFALALPYELTDTEIAKQEWHLMHDVEMSETMLSAGCIELQLAGISGYAEVRVNGVAVMDCDSAIEALPICQNEWPHYVSLQRKNIRSYLHQGGNRIEILLLHDNDEWLIEPDVQDDAGHGLVPYRQCELNDGEAARFGIATAPRLVFAPHVELRQVDAEQIWHHGGGCEVKVTLHYQVHRPSLVSAAIKFDGMTYRVPLDMRSQQVSALFQIEAPRATSIQTPVQTPLYWLNIELDNLSFDYPITLNPALCVTLNELTPESERA
ncbi:hypothetical protein HGP28_11850 [Vibrio sp. SM6]|uniref:Beta-galactosidase n=1 Tax=Vibrio agarilyticus TaxID=2726741 RepID=A0A7X8YHK1_9VIBR|nr:hypothetical protein [Vibrio agarilyticus]NLS13586.1 hypothetical protein [Vibrio agarilyticus]